jgi:hypothetical protein
MATKHRSYSFTLNNYVDTDVSMLKEIECKYIIFGKEIGESGTPHLQGCINFKSPISFTSIKKKIPKAHIEPTKSLVGSRDYCKKDGDFYECGEPPQPGKRTDIEEVRDILNEGGNLRTVVQTAKSVQSIRMAEIHLKYFEKKRNWKPTVVWYHGPPGSGKSRKAFEECQEHDPYVAMSTGRWFEGYDAHTHVIIDDMRRDFMKFHELLRMLDRYPFQVECKGGSRQFVATHIYITSCYSPTEMFVDRCDENMKQLTRRIDIVQEFFSHL